MREDISFYVFPSKPYEQERRRRWIQAVRRADEDGQPWQPGPNSRICSRHFVGNKMSNIMHHPAYVPTIFPSEYHRQAPSDASAPSERYERWAARHRSSADFSVGACQPTQLDKGQYMQPENDDKDKDVCSQSHSHLDPDKNASFLPLIASPVMLHDIGLLTCCLHCVTTQWNVVQSYVKCFYLSRAGKM
ncbi:uncharacterized protein LOC125947454 [Dermacentor silvarum]|uniref:uncharacterized protein LOC125947454 n=1 Tax=Dermacentor silvarum TaxID=543639 RepID=UPI002101A2DD|nr:uncharacterized protein LOC125947454 [Dermacentor silvarum]